MDWFLYDNDLRHERVKIQNNPNQIFAIVNFEQIRHIGLFFVDFGQVNVD